jgi:hypothetical protein
MPEAACESIKTDPPSTRDLLRYGRRFGVLIIGLAIVGSLLEGLLFCAARRFGTDWVPRKLIFIGALSVGIFLTMGTAYVIEPRLWAALQPATKDLVPRWLRPVGFVIVIVGAAIGCAAGFWLAEYGLTAE